MLIDSGAHPKPNHYLCIHPTTPPTGLGKARGSPIDSDNTFCLSNFELASWHPLSDIAVLFIYALRTIWEAASV
jgi:hypothetical protein